MLLLCIFSSILFLRYHIIVEASNGSTTHIVQVYNSSDEPVALDCADGSEIDAREIQTMEKLWQKGRQDSFKTDNIIFVENNKSIRFTSLSMEDSGIYSCCLRSSEDKTLKCFDQSLIVVNSINDTTALLCGGNVTGEDRNGPVWSVALTEDHLLNAREGDSYFLKLFHGNTSDVRCISNGTEDSIHTVGNSSSQYGDILIQNFNESLHSGSYSCNASFIHDNITDEVEVDITFPGFFPHQNISPQLFPDYIHSYRISTTKYPSKNA